MRTKIKTRMTVLLHDHTGLKQIVMEKAFLGSCKGIGLRKRGERDRHVTFTVLTEDDGTWFATDSGASSSYWMGELAQTLKSALAWIKRNCEPDLHSPDLHSVVQYGWKFPAEE